MEAFLKCDNDGIHGLSWDEIEKCEEEFCSMLTIPCPDQEDFESFDEDGDGSLTLKEYFHHMQNLKDNEHRNFVNNPRLFILKKFLGVWGLLKRVVY